jgi:hypothetical protein
MKDVAKPHPEGMNDDMMEKIYATSSEAFKTTASDPSGNGV